MKQLALPGLGLLLAVAPLQAQRSMEHGFGSTRLEKHRLQLNLLKPGLRYEFALPSILTVGAGLGLGPSLHLNLGWNPFAKKKQRPVFLNKD